MQVVTLIHLKLFYRFMIIKALQMRGKKINLLWTHNQNKEHIDQEESKHQKGK